ncbi:hypothetical protein E3U36_00340 [Arsenophonus endosymbiont of Aphis craccivora]|uniref:hypothetical protein n=1 Tax=Arsenophonus endosymbiont of Aphis craccivora TaxID=1231049 RepID=UPI0015DBED73|nr:hypothetical protein [Arsenophonus endosymbiont of Aphis craccivora]QLK87044.1 hypothetical protein E3U36_00340 [Arsenophonus endosymbiont of Aphis craccivora]
MPWGPDVETNLAISSANHLKVRFIQQSQDNIQPIYRKSHKMCNDRIFASYFLKQSLSSY